MPKYAIDEGGEDRLEVRGTGRSGFVNVLLDGREVASGRPAEFAGGRKVELGGGVTVEVRLVRNLGVEVSRAGRRLHGSPLVRRDAPAWDTALPLFVAAFVCGMGGLAAFVLSSGLPPEEHQASTRVLEAYPIALAALLVALGIAVWRGSLVCAWIGFGILVVGGLFALMSLDTSATFVCGVVGLWVHVGIRRMHAVRRRDAAERAGRVPLAVP